MTRDEVLLFKVRRQQLSTRTKSRVPRMTARCVRPRAAFACALTLVARQLVRWVQAFAPAETSDGGEGGGGNTRPFTLFHSAFELPHEVGTSTSGASAPPLPSARKSLEVRCVVAWS